MEPLVSGDPRAVGPYRILGRLGAGGMGVVYQGSSPGGRLVAIKCVHPHLAGEPGFRDRFVHELEAMRRVGGFHTVLVVDADADAASPWIATAFVPGPSLEQAVQTEGAWAEARLRTLGAGLAEALVAVHAVGLVHRDVKPSNVIVADDGVRLIDFGIARLLDGTRLTASHISVGSLGFMAPEQIAAEEVSAACDVFQLGCVVCFAAGCRPFGEGSAATLLYRIAHGRPELDVVPKALREVVAASLAVDPAARPTPRELVTEFGEFGEFAAPVPASSVPQVPAPPPPLSVAPTENRAVLDPAALPQPQPHPAPAPAFPPPAAPRRRWWMLALSVLVLGAAGTAVPLLLSSGSGSSCALAGAATSVPPSPAPRASLRTPVPHGTPHPAQPVAPEDHATDVVGRPITLRWNATGKVSRVVVNHVNNPSGTRAPGPLQLLYDAWRSATSCVFTPSAAGVYAWSVQTSADADGGRPAAASEQRLIVVRANDQDTSDPIAGTPAPPKPVSPADQQVVPVGQPVTLTWSTDEQWSFPVIEQPDGTFPVSTGQPGKSWTFTPTEPGVYVWFVRASGSLHPELLSGLSEGRYLTAR